MRRVDSIVHEPQELLYLIQTLGADRIVLGTDLPFDMGVKEPIELFGAPLSDEIRRYILAGHQTLVE
jgi:aminocarboxymuconate-semialdehyde decarboxylase